MIDDEMMIASTVVYQTLGSLSTISYLTLRLLSSVSYFILRFLSTGIPDVQCF